MGRTRRPESSLGVVSALALAMVASVVVTLAGVREVAAADGMDIAADARFTIDAPTGVVIVENTYTITNTLSDTRRGNTVEKPYFKGFSAPITTNNFGLSVEQDGRPLDSFTVASEVGNAMYTRLDITFAKNLFAKKTTTLVVRYIMVGGQPRDPLNPTRINAAFAAFPAFAAGDPGKAAVHVVVPQTWDIDQLSGDPQTVEAFGNKIATVDNISDPTQFTVWVIASNPDQLASSTVADGDGNRFEILSWPNDTGWADFVKQHVTTQMPKLAELIGQEWPIVGSLRVVETITPSLTGYAGGFFPGLRMIQIGERLDQMTMLHELAHAWFHDQWFTDRWVGEGLAEVYAAQLMRDLGNTPVPPLPVATTDEGYIALNGWDALSATSVGTDAAEQFAYNASYLVMNTIAGEVGLDKMREVFAAIAKGRPVYSRPDQTGLINSVSTQSGWRRMLDLFEDVAGSKLAAELFRNRVVTEEQRPELERRAAVRAAFADVQQLAGTWALPTALTGSMEGWNWDDAERLIADATGLLAVRDEVSAKAVAAGTTLPASFAERFRATIHATMPNLEQDLRDFAASLPAASTTATGVPPTTATTDATGPASTKG